jgi:hypothetical protein
MDRKEYSYLMKLNAFRGDFKGLLYLTVLKLNFNSCWVTANYHKYSWTLFKPLN